MEVWVPVLVALIVGGLGGLSQWLLKRQDYKRQDEVAARVEQVAKAAADATTTTNGKLDDVHRIVNQQRTDMQRYQEALVAALQRAGVDIPRDESLK